jgi:hypothetical protein
MRNVPGTHDGSNFIGRGGPQWTGRDGYENLQKLTGIPCVNTPSLASSPALQPEICTAFWTWKKLNAPADRGDFTAVVKLWNGGTNGMADRLLRLKGNDPFVLRATTVSVISSMIPDVPKLIPDVPKLIPVPATPIPTIKPSMFAVAASYVSSLFKKA